jgi:hypothetical protein
MSFQDSILSGTIVAPTAQVCASTILLLLTAGNLNKVYMVGVASNGITFVPKKFN